jgi:hypothetical protein
MMLFTNVQNLNSRYLILWATQKWKTLINFETWNSAMFSTIYVGEVSSENRHWVKTLKLPFCTIGSTADGPDRKWEPNRSLKHASADNPLHLPICLEKIQLKKEGTIHPHCPSTICAAMETPSELSSWSPCALALRRCVPCQSPDPSHETSSSPSFGPVQEPCAICDPPRAAGPGQPPLPNADSVPRWRIATASLQLFSNSHPVFFFACCLADGTAQRCCLNSS